MAIPKRISSLQHPLIKHIVHLRQNSDYRYDHKSVVVEGEKVIKELKANHRIKMLVVADESKIPLKINADEILIVDAALMKKASGVQNPEGILVEMAMPEFSTLEKGRYIIALDQINDPGNLGTILRTALALNFDGAFLIGNGCDPYNEKALRAARGATFKMPLRRGDHREFSLFAAKHGGPLFVADLNGESISQIKKPSSCILVLCNEAHGPREEIEKECKKITIPMNEAMESLNVAVAGAIAMYMLRPE